MPLEFTNSSLSISFGRANLATEVQSRTLRTIQVSGITLRLAFGPTRDGMITFRLRPVMPPDSVPEPPARILPDRPPLTVEFGLVPEDPHPGLVSLTRDMKVCFTLERIDGEDGQLIFENPDATELLWQALGRPSFSNQ
jgi:hypothetical protein